MVEVPPGRAYVGGVACFKVEEVASLSRLPNAIDVDVPDGAQRLALVDPLKAFERLPAAANW